VKKSEIETVTIEEAERHIKDGLEVYRRNRPLFLKWVDDFVAFVRRYFELKDAGDRLMKEWQKIREPKPIPLARDYGKAEYRCPRCATVIPEGKGKEYAWGKRGKIIVCKRCYNILTGSKLIK